MKTNHQRNSPGNSRICPYRIVIIAPFSPPMGGMAVQAELLSNLLVREKVPVSKISYTQKITGRFQWLEKLRGIRTIAHLIAFIKKCMREARKNTIFHILGCSFESFFLWVVPALFIANRSGVPVIINYRGGNLERFLKKYKKSLLFFLKKANAIVVPSEFLHYIFIKNGIYAHIIPNIIEPIEPISNSNHHAEGPHILVNRNFETIYNISCAIYAFALVQAKIPDARLTLIGDGTKREELKKLVSELQLKHVTFTGPLPNHEVRRLLQQCDILLNPTNVDNLPISLLEAMSAGIPIISTQVGGIPYLIEDRKTGILVAPDNHIEMARAVLELLKSPKLRERLVRHAKRKSREFLWQNVWPKWRSMYETLHRRYIERSELSAIPPNSAPEISSSKELGPVAK